jgi:hypothetical protein
MWIEAQDGGADGPCRRLAGPDDPRSPITIGGDVTQRAALKKVKKSHWKSLEKLVRQAYQEGKDDGITQAHGQGRRGRTIREDATVEGLIRLIQEHFGLDRYRFEIRVVHPGSKRQVASADPLRKYRAEE